MNKIEEPIELDTIRVELDDAVCNLDIRCIYRLLKNKYITDKSSNVSFFSNLSNNMYPEIGYTEWPDEMMDNPLDIIDFKKRAYEIRKLLVDKQLPLLHFEQYRIIRRFLKVRAFYA